MKAYLKTIAELMAVAARTAPKAAGQDFIKIEILEGAVLEKLSEAMTEFGVKSDKKNFDRDARNVKNSAAVLLVGLKNAKATGLNCGACGYADCKKLPDQTEGPEFKGPQCAYRLIDLGIALGSAVKTASILNADNRIMYTIGAAAMRLKLMDSDVIMGIPISISGKSPFFDRKA